MSRRKALVALHSFIPMNKEVSSATELQPYLHPPSGHVQKSSDRTLCGRVGCSREIRNRICCGIYARQRPHEDGCRQSSFHRAEGCAGRTQDHEELPLETRTGSLRPVERLKKAKTLYAGKGKSPVLERFSLFYLHICKICCTSTFSPI